MQRKICREIVNRPIPNSRTIISTGLMNFLTLLKSAWTTIRDDILNTCCNIKSVNVSSLSFMESCVLAVFMRGRAVGVFGFMSVDIKMI